ncbi:MAG TPA: phospholipase [Rikenellaceae bacterium]|nr:phospholipase [Rikenellaceae bacterium]
MITSKNKDVALVLASGGPRGFAYIGAIEELEARGYNITSVAGCSIGSLVGGIYAAGGLDDFKKWLFKLNNYKLLGLLDISLSKSYLVKGEKVINAIKSIVPDVNIEDLRIPYRAVATDLYTGEQVIFKEGKLFEAIRSSISIPSMFRPVRLGYHTMVDGGILNTVPMDIAVRNGHDILVTFDVNQIDSEKISSSLVAYHNAKNQYSDSKIFVKEILEQLPSQKDKSLLEVAKWVGDETHKLILKDKNAHNKSKEIDRKAEEANMPFMEDDNYYSILSRSFSLMLSTVARLQLQLYKPDILVKMNFDSYGNITDYTKGAEISDKGRELMARALDEYEKAQ